jgi:hypothetical protein
LVDLPELFKLIFSIALFALEKLEQRFSDIHPVYLPPGDAGAAFESGKLKAWGMLILSALSQDRLIVYRAIRADYPFRLWLPET